MKLMIISGRSGSGKSICLHVLEDLGYYCIDNLPVSMIPALTQALATIHNKVAVSIDIRNATERLTELGDILDVLQQQGIEHEIIFLEADDETILRRYGETRRKHPLTRDDVSLSEALNTERLYLEPILERVDLTIDTSHLTMHQLRDELDTRLKQRTQQHALSLLFISFGYKFGTPLDADYMFDVRCLPNPFWQAGLSRFTGHDKNVQAFMQQQPKTHKLLQDIDCFLLNWIPHFETANRRYLNIAIGCTGGQHRSVYMVEKLSQAFKQRDYTVQTRHRELT